MRPIRRPSAYVLLAVLLLALQWGAVLHGFAHVLESAGGHGRDEGGLPGSAACVTCIAFAPMGAALPSTPAAVPPLLHASFLPPLPGPAIIRACAPRSYLARAPPFLV